MTAGRGISHSEETPADNSGVLQGVQLWVALPSTARGMAPAFTHHEDLPVVPFGGLTATVLMGTLGDASSPAETHTPLVGAELSGTAGVVPLRPDFEYAVLVMDGAATIEGHDLKPGPLLYLGQGLTSLHIEASEPARMLLLGGEPFEEQLVMWWNFVGRTHEEIVAARAEWESGSAFGEVHGYAGPPIPAPPMPITRLLPRGRTR
jgi:redox-sensitive bicupin YhaK (pirin superfamily)